MGFRIFKQSNSSNFHLINQVLQSLFSFVITFLAIKIFSQQIFGEFSYMYSFSAVCLIPAQAYTFLPIINYFKSKIKINKITFKNGIIGIFIFIIPCFLFLGYLNYKALDLFFFALFIYTFFCFEFLRKILTCEESLNKILIMQLVRFSIFFVGYFNFNNFSIQSYFLLLILANTLSIMLFFNYFLKTIRQKSEEDNREVLSFSSDVIKSNLIDHLSDNIALYLIALFITQSEIALINAPKIVMGLSTIFILSLENKSTLELSNDSSTLYSKIIMIFKNNIFYFIPIIFIIIILMLTGKKLSILLFGSEYNNNLLLIFSIYSFFLLVTRPILVVLRKSKLRNYLPKISLHILIVSIILIYPLIKLYGHYGVVYLMIILQLVKIIYFLTLISIKENG